MRLQRLVAEVSVEFRIIKEMERVLGTDCGILTSLAGGTREMMPPLLPTAMPDALDYLLKRLMSEARKAHRARPDQERRILARIGMLLKLYRDSTALTFEAPRHAD